MLKKTVEYFDYDNNKRTETLYFNLNQSELIEIAMDLPDSVSKSVGDDPTKIDEKQAAAAVIDALGKKGVVKFIKDILLKSYGIKSEDGRRFQKSEKISNEFAQTIAFDTIYMELMANDNAASDFINAVIPATVVEKMTISK